MSLRYTGAWLQDGAFNPLVAPTPTILYNLYAWGDNSQGEMGVGNTTNYYSSPKQVGSLTNWSAISGGNLSSLAVKKDGTLWTWGRNNYGQLGLGNTTNYSSPVQVGVLTNWLKISGTTGGSAAAIKTDGTLWTWGRNFAGQLGLGNTTNYSSPKQVGALTNWNFIQGYYHFLAVKTDGTLWSWGAGNAGCLGLGNSTYYSSPKQVGGSTNWSTTSCGTYSSIAVKTDGTLWGWGRNDVGQLGLSFTSYGVSSPTQIGALTNWAQAVISQFATLAVKTDGTIWAWGNNAQGQLGLGDTSNRNSPNQIGTLTNWLTVSTNGSTSFAIKTNTTLWAWGTGSSGQLGNNATNSYSSPIQIGSSTTWLSIALSSSSSLALG